MNFRRLRELAEKAETLASYAEHMRRVKRWPMSGATPHIPDNVWRSLDQGELALAIAPVIDAARKKIEAEILAVTSTER